MGRSRHGNEAFASWTSPAQGCCNVAGRWKPDDRQPSEARDASDASDGGGGHDRPVDGPGGTRAHRTRVRPAARGGKRVRAAAIAAARALPGDAPAGDRRGGCTPGGVDGRVRPAVPASPELHALAATSRVCRALLRPACAGRRGGELADDGALAGTSGGRGAGTRARSARGPPVRGSSAHARSLPPRDASSTKRAPAAGDLTWTSLESG